MRDRLLQPGFPAGFHLFFGGGGGVEGLWGGGSSLGVNKNKVSKNLGGGGVTGFFFFGGGGLPPKTGLQETLTTFCWSVNVTVNVYFHQ